MVDINRANLDRFFVGLQNNFRSGLETRMPFDTRLISTLVNSDTAGEDYTWLGEADDVREWFGPRVAKQLASHDYTIKNRLFELTLKAKKHDLEDDRIALYGTRAKLMGESCSRWEPKLVAETLIAGTSKLCYDGQFYFDTDHPVGKDGNITTWSNKRGGSDREAFYVMDLSQTLKPLVFQLRQAAKFASLDRDTDDHVFNYNEFLYGSSMRGAGGYTFPHFAVHSQTGSSVSALITELKAIRTLMRSYKNDEGRLLGINPTHIVCGPSNQDIFEQVLDTQFLDYAQGTPNPLYKKLTLTVVPYLP